MYVLTIARGGPKLTPSKDHEKPVLVGKWQSVGTGWRQSASRTKGFDGTTGVALGFPAVTDGPVLDCTGLTGEFTFEAKFTLVDNNGVNNTLGPSIFTALQEQLGLKLEAAEAPLEVLVIDHAKNPARTD